MTWIALTLAAAVLTVVTGRLPALRPLVAAVLTGGAVAALLLQPGDVLAPAVVLGVALRVWCDLPELQRLGPVHRADVLVEATGGLAVTLLAVLTARGTRDLPAAATLLTVAAVVLLLAPVLRLLRR